MTTAFVREGSDGSYAVMRGDAVVSSHAARDEALDAALVANGIAPRETILRSSEGAPNGVMRWLSASTPEVAQDDEGNDVPIDRATIEEAVAFLNAEPNAIGIDGGEGSIVHGLSETRGNVAVNGWGHHAVVLERSDGTPHAMLRAELLPDLASDVDTGRRAFGSVDWRFDRAATKKAKAARGVTWVSHAITNTPANRRLMPSTTRASAESTERGRLLASSKRLTMTEPKIVRAPKDQPPPAPTGAPPKPPVARADPPAPSVPPTADGDLAAQVAAQAQQIARLTALVEALTEERNAAVGEAPDPEALAMAAVEKAITEGRILAAQKDKWLAVARLGVPQFEAATKALRAFPGKGGSLARAGEAAPRHGDTKPSVTEPKVDVVLDENDPDVKCMRAAKVSDAGIRRALAKRAPKEV